MKFIQSAAGDDDEENEEQIRRLQEDLKVMLQKCKALELEQSASRVSKNKTCLFLLFAHMCIYVIIKNRVFAKSQNLNPG